MLYEERRHLEVKAHRHTDTRYYADFNYYDELEKLAAIQDLWLANLRPLALTKNHAQHILEVPGRPGHIAACQVRLTIRPDIPQDALILLLAKFGGKAVISSTTLKT